MTKKGMKRGLLLSAIALCMCFALLLGTTFAWFTDSVTSSNNIIASGDLKVEMYWADGTEAVPADENGWTDASEGAIFNYDKWEPGYVEVRHIKIANVGSLALKYQVNIVANGEVSALADVIDVYYADPAVQVADRSALTEENKLGTLTEVLANLGESGRGNLLASEADVITIAFKMQESAGNAYMGLSIGSDFSIQLVATQYTAETDSFDDQYDALATIDNVDELNAALAADYELIMLGADIELTESLVIPADKTVTIDLCGNKLYQAYEQTGAMYSMIDNSGTLTIMDSVGSGKISYEDIGMGGEYASNTIRNLGTLTINGGTIENVSSDAVMRAGYPHAIDVYPGSVTTINGGTVKSVNYDSIRMFCNSTTDATKVVINGGTIVNRVSFQNPNNNTHTPGYGILEINGGNFVTTENVTANVRLLNFSRDYSNMKATVTGGTFDKGFKTQDYAGCGVTMSDWLNIGDSVAPVATADELAAAIAAGGNIVLVADVTGINANTAITIPAGADVTLDLNGHKISATANKTNNQELFLVKGNMVVENGSVELTAENNQGWGAMATIFDVTAGGSLKLDNVSASVAGTDMNFIVHLNNWGTASAEITNCSFDLSYVAVRAFNSGYDMNTVTIKDTDVTGGARLFWVHNYTAEGKDDSTLTLDIYGNGNTVESTEPVRFGFSGAVYYDLDGNLIP